MKTSIPLSLIAGLALLWAGTPSMAAEARDLERVRETYADIHSRLDAGGDLMVVANVDGLLEDALKSLRNMFLLGPADEMAEVLETMDRIGQFLQANGFYAVQGLGLSVVPRADGRNDIKLFIAREATAARLPFWRGYVGAAPVAMNVHAYLPRDTVTAVSTTGDMRFSWQLVRNAVSEVGGPEGGAALEQGLQAFADLAGRTADELIGSLRPETLFSVQLSETETLPVPLGDAENAIAIPLPSLLYIVGVEDDTVINTVQHLMQTMTGEELPGQREEDATLYALPFSPPIPIPLQPTLGVHGNYLLIGSSPEVVRSAISAARHRDGLLATADFMQAFPDIDKPNNGIHFISERLGEVLQQVRNEALAQSSGEGPEAAYMAALMETKAQTGLALTLYNLPSGIHLTGAGHLGVRDLVGATVIAPVGLMAAIALPAFANARMHAQEVGCTNNLRMLDAAKEQHAMMANLSEGALVTADQLSEYLFGGMPECPEGGIYTLGPVGTPPSCSVHGGLPGWDFDDF